MAATRVIIGAIPTITGLVFALLLACVAFCAKALLNPLAKVPGPWHTRFTDLVARRLYYSGHKVHYVHALHEKYGPVVRVSPHEVSVLDIPATKEIHTVKATFKKAPWYTQISTPNCENVFSTLDVDFHRRHRRLLQRAMTETNLKGFGPVIAHRAEMAIQRMKDETRTRGATDIMKWNYFYATDSIGQLSFGESFRTLETGEKCEYTRHLERQGRIAATRATFPLLANLALYVPIPGFRDSTDSARKNLQYAEMSLARYQRLLEQDPENPPPTLFTRLFKGEEDETLTFKEIRDEAVIYIVAGTDTTGIALTYLIWAVCRDHAVRDRLVAELSGLPRDGDGRVLFDDNHLRQLHYLNQVIEETLRLYAPAPAALPRVVPPGGVTLAGHDLPGGTVVSTQAYSLHRMPSIYPDPETFNPSRWEVTTKEMRDAFMPWGGGSRICIGSHLAKMELRSLTARFFTEFPRARVSNLEGMCDEDMEPKIFFLLSPEASRCLIECR